MCDNIDKIVYINLDTQTQRNHKIINELERLHIPNEKIIRFSGIKNDISQLGCVLSHIEVLKMARDNNWSNVLILEDDFTFINDVKFISNMFQQFFDFFRNDWDVVNLSRGYHNDLHDIDNNNNFLKVNDNSTTCAYLVNSNFYDILIQNFSEGYDLLTLDITESNYCLSRYWKKIMPDSLWYLCNPSIGYLKNNDNDFNYKEYDKTITNNIATSTPVVVPAVVPIMTPFKPPVKIPVIVPVIAPVKEPIKIPVIAPVKAPVIASVIAPVETPVIVPITKPVKAPIKIPVIAPVKAPVKAPIKIPVIAPVETPVKIPVIAPVKAPVKAPIKIPVIAPVKAPVKAPIKIPVIAPVKLSPIQPPVQAYIPPPVRQLTNTKYYNRFFNKIDKIVYINLDKREDRKKEIMNEFNRLEIPADKIIRFSAISHNKGEIGCSMSHIEVIKMAKKNNWNNILILEDDFNFINDVEFIDRIFNYFFDTYPNNSWDVINLNRGYFQKFQDSGNKYFFKVIDVSTTSGYMVNNHFYDTLLNNFEEGCKQLISTYDTSKYSIDRYWNKLQCISNWYMFNPSIGYQRVGFSDLCNQVVNYIEFDKTVSFDKINFSI